MSDVTTRTAVVTGASRGIGRAIAQRLARDGALVAVYYGHSEEAAKDTLATIERQGGHGFLVPAELGPPGAADSLVAGLAAGLRC